MPDQAVEDRHISKRERERIVEQIYGQRLFREFIGKRSIYLHPADRSLATSERLGISQYGKGKSAPIFRALSRRLTVALPIISTATKACFYQMQEAGGIPIELREEFTHWATYSDSSRAAPADRRSTSFRSA